MTKRLKLVFFALMAMTLFIVAGCGDNNEQEPEENDQGAAEEEATEEQNGEEEAAVEGSGELVVYSSRNETFVDELLEKFETETGIKVEAYHGGDDAINRIKREGENAYADIFISNDIGALEHLRMEGLLQAYAPENIESIDERFRAEDNSWIGLSARTRVFMYNKDEVTEEELPSTLWELTDSKYAGQFAITRGGNGSMIAQVSALRQEWGDEKVSEWLSIVKDNAAIITEGHGDIRRAVGSGEVAFGLVNNYYYHQQLEEPTDNNVGVVYPDQGDDDMGAIVNAAGVGFIHHAPNEDNAKLFLDWLLKDENQEVFSFNSMEVPVNPDIDAYEHAMKISEYKTHEMPLSKLGEVWEDTRELIEQSGLDLEIR
ncbi:iron(III) transport system substrate-binding protein [Evansella caseinilytica]|uniref:Iron(III) transport system substrate-binding protein n=1 Tax=Evansella caseinilytica TaxID=1503961 RepID=A0A1H3UA94_9BACI|nr:extracellular solute-binding protein [Evansella caseinilytica]SDZ58735.1 iron(III) transport system substrate-binding protein [Evansella caseinilytica]